MSVLGGPKVSTNGLVFSYDIANDKSFRGESTENLLLFSDRLSGGNWTGYCGTLSNVTTNSTDVYGPNGTYSATKIVRDSNTTCGAGSAFGLYWNSSSTISSGSVYTISCFARAFSGSVVVNLALNDVNSSTQTITTEWKRLTYTATASSTSRGFQILSTAANVTYYVFGAQLERKSYASPYVSSTSVTGSRIGVLSSIAGSMTGSLSGGVSYISSSLGALSYDGAGGLVTFPIIANSPVDITSSITLEAVVNIRANVSYGSIFLFGQENGEQYSLNTMGSGKFMLGTNWPGTWYQATSTESYPLNSWVHVAATFFNGTVNFYFNGAFSSTHALGTSALTAFASSFLTLGCNIPGGDEYFNGSMAIGRIYNRVLTAQEILQNYNATKSRFSL